MVETLPIAYGAPGIYRAGLTPVRALTGVRMDVCGFLGVAPRGPAREPVLDPIRRDGRPDPRVVRQMRRTVPVVVESFDEYRRVFGGFEGPGRLPYAVAAFFEQGGQRAYVARVVHQYATTAENAARVAQGAVGGATTTAGPLRLWARNEGRWGNALRARLTFRHTPLNVVAFTSTSVVVGAGEPLGRGTLLRLILPGGVRLHRFIVGLDEPWDQLPGTGGTGLFDMPVAETPEQAEVVTADLVLDDGAGQAETHPAMGLAPEHPRWLGTALAYDSELVRPDGSWLNVRVVPDPDAAAVAFHGGEDDYRRITPGDFLDPGWTLSDPEPGDGIAAFTHLPDLSLVVVPDLYSPGPLVPVEPIRDPPSLAGPTFARCVTVRQPPLEPAPRPDDLEGLRLDPQVDLAQIEAWQRALVEFADQQRSWVVLLDVPPGLTHRQVLTWRSRFNSAYAAAYHPWLKVARTDDRRDALIQVPPSAVAAGIIARRELESGVAHGPANVLAMQVVALAERVAPAHHDELHPAGVNVFLQERDGVRLTGARTLSRDAAWRQLSVRRLVTLIARTLEQQMQWAVFEPNHRALRAEIRLMLRSYLRQLFRLGAFRGASEDEAFFVRCDDENNPPPVTDAGRLIAEVGVAPAEPLEFIVLRLVREGDGTLLLRER